MTRLANDAPGRALDILHDSRLAALGDYSGIVRFYDLETHTLIKQFAPHPDHLVHDVCLSIRGDLLITAGSDDLVRTWSFPSLTLMHTLEGHRGAYGP